MRRRLRDVGSRITGALAATRDEGASDPSPTEPTEPTDPNAPVATAAAGPPAAAQVREPGPDGEASTQPAGDPACIAAVELARVAAEEVAGPSVGEHLGVEVDEALVVTHSFATTEKAYRGWRWAVTVARADGDARVTVDEVVLLPGSEALVSPAWVPWSDRILPGDLSPGDVLPPKPGDPRLVPSYADPEDQDEWSAVHWELGLGRHRVLSRDGRADAAERWYEGEPGPANPLAKAAPARCGDCGFLVPLAGSLRALFGVCANLYAPDDARVVSVDHGCGAHSEVIADAASQTWTGMAVEHDELELVERSSAHSPGTVQDADPAESLGHS